jgi:hypothetical protein
VVKKLLLKILIIGLLPIMSVSADTWFTSQVKIVYPLANGDFVVLFDSPNPSCIHSGGYHYVELNNNGISESGRDKMYSAFFDCGEWN